jgi:hypothetical protein
VVKGRPFSWGKRCDPRFISASSNAIKEDIRLPGKVNPNSHGARPVHRVIAKIKRFRTSRLSIKNSFSLAAVVRGRQFCWGKRCDPRSISASFNASRYTSLSRCTVEQKFRVMRPQASARTNVAQLRQSKPDSGHDLSHFGGKSPQHLVRCFF